MGNLILALEKIASMELRNTTDQAASVDLRRSSKSCGSSWNRRSRNRASNCTGKSTMPLPAGLGGPAEPDAGISESHAKQRARHAGPAAAQLTITAVRASRTRNDSVSRYRMRSGPSGTLFRPFQQQAQATGLGLYLSRAFMRSFRGDLRYEPRTRRIELHRGTDAAHRERRFMNPIRILLRGRSQPVPREPQPVARG